MSINALHQAPNRACPINSHASSFYFLNYFFLFFLLIPPLLQSPPSCLLPSSSILVQGSPRFTNLVKIVNNRRQWLLQVNPSLSTHKLSIVSIIISRFLFLPPYFLDLVHNFVFGRERFSSFDIDLFTLNQSTELSFLSCDEDHAAVNTV